MTAKKQKRKKRPPVPARPADPDENLVLYSDIHVGCGLALCHPDGFKRDEGGTYMPSEDQLLLWRYWREFWDDWVPEVTLGEPFTAVCLGEMIDGVHHQSVTQITHNLGDQVRHSTKINGEVARRCGGRFYALRGTEAHAGKSAQEAERVARDVGAIPDKLGHHARYELWYRMGSPERGGLIHMMHHIGTTGSSHYESSAPMKELTEAFVEAGRWGDEPPRVVVRAHRHRHIQLRIPSERGDSISCTMPAWQLKTPLVYRIAGGRQAQPQIGGIVVRYHRGELYVRNKVWRVERPKEVSFDTSRNAAELRERAEICPAS